MQTKPKIALSIGDAAGIGPEVIAKAWASRDVHDYCTPVLIGSKEVMEQAANIAGVNLKIRVLNSIDDLDHSPDELQMLDSNTLDFSKVVAGQESVVCGQASADWLDETDKLAREGKVDATIMGPISTGSMKMAGVLDKVVNIEPGLSYLFLVSGPLRVMHLTDHMSLRKVCGLISAELVFGALNTLDSAMQSWGISKPRIAVAGLNPHASGVEEEESIIPGIEMARNTGIQVSGPIAPDTVFRQCIEEQYDVILAMYHDQGHIAVKTWGFVGNCAIILGPPYLHMSVAHGTAYDIAGKGIANHEMMLTAMKLSGSLASGSGFQH